MAPKMVWNCVEQQLRLLIMVLGILTLLAWIVTFYLTSIYH